MDLAKLLNVHININELLNVHIDVAKLLNVHICTKNSKMTLDSIFFLLQLDLVQLRVCSSKINFNQQQNNNNFLFHW